VSSLPVFQGGHPEAAARFVENEPRTHWHDQSLWFVREKRDRAASLVPDWEALRDAAAGIRAHVRGRLPELLEEFERNAVARGAKVHWAADAGEHNEIVHRILAERGVTRLVKSKSMLTEECGLNPYLEARGIEVVDTDLGERIVQLRHEPPSHIIFSAIHLKREEIGELFHEKLSTPAGLSDPTKLTEAARGHLRQRFLRAQAGLTGVNFAVAETGGVVVCTNEGNADMGTSLPPVHIACMGVEKIVPSLEHLAVLIRLLARSATGQPVTSYTSHFHGPMPGGELHIVVVDNGRSRLLADPAVRGLLACIRCGACLNTCPVYRRSGGYSYGWVVPGPIGSALAAARDPASHATLPFASTLCGSCDAVCPVRIPIHDTLLGERRTLAARGLIAPGKRLGLALVGLLLRSRASYEAAGGLLRFALKWFPRFLLYGPWNVWGRRRELPAPPVESFRQTWRRTRGPLPSPAPRGKGSPGTSAGGSPRG